MNEPIPIRYLYAIPLRGVAIRHLGDAIEMRWEAGTDCVVRLTPNAEGDIALPGRRHAGLMLSLELRADGDVSLRTRLRGNGWLPSHTELWEDHPVRPGRQVVRIDMSEFQLCQSSGSAGYLQLEWRDEADGQMLLDALSVEEHDGASFFAARVDRFGQRLSGNWVGKVQDEAQLKADAAAPLPEPLPGRDRFGGWAEGPRHEATGFFHAEQVDGRWWLITPQGARFRSFGPCCVSPGVIRAHTKGDQHLFTALPERCGVEVQAWQGAAGGGSGEPEMRTRDSFGHDAASTIVSYYIANLIRKWGDRWFAKWSETTAARLRSWGMNTLACWSDLEVAAVTRMPYCTSAERLCPFDFGDLLPGRDRGPFALTDVPDVMHPAFEQRARGMFAGLAERRDDPFLIGYFVHNEQPWCLWHSPFALPRSWQSRRMFVAELRDRYGSIERLNSAWHTGFDSYEHLADFVEPQNPPGLSAEGVAACDDFMRRFTDRYFAVVRRELHRADPNHMFLGCRFLALPPRRCVVEGITANTDVVSINWYLWHKQQPEDAGAFLGGWQEMCGGKPLMITEYSFTATDQRLLACHLSHFDQAQRAAIAERFTTACLELPSVVGMHWFQYADQPITGRTLGDGERANFGLVDICDRPYPSMVNIMRRAAERLYTPGT